MYNFRCVDNINMNTQKDNSMMYNGNVNITGMECPVIYECPIGRVCHREIHHHVPHVCPINTRIVNHHIYNHTYTPQYTCCEENEKCDIYQGNCDNF